MLGLLSLGPSGAERSLASAEALAAVARLEREVWATRFAVDRARAAVAAARTRRDLLAELGRTAGADLARVDVLHRNGRLSESRASAARAEVLELAAARSRAAEELAAAHHALVLASGLPPDHAALDAPGPETLAALAARPVPGEPGEPAEPDEPRVGARAVDTHPELRAARVAVAVAEARLRAVAARAWPGIQLGPYVAFPDSGTNLGGVVQLSLPFPDSWRGALEAAGEARARSFEVLEEAVLARASRARAAELRLAEARGRLERESRPAAAAAAKGWTASRARFRAGHADVHEWTAALARHRRAMLAPVDDAAAAAVAALDLREARGPATARERGEERP